MSDTYHSCISWFGVMFIIIIIVTSSYFCEPLVCKTFEKVDSLDDKSCKPGHLEASIEHCSEISCLSTCSRWLHSTSLFYNAANGACKCCSEHYITQDGLSTDVGTKHYTTGPDPACINYLVSGPNGVQDDQLTDSGHWCQYHACREHVKGDTSAKFARLNATGFKTGAWIAPKYPFEDGYVQVYFHQMKTIVGVVLKGRSPSFDAWKPETGLIVEYVTSFKVLTSRDCVKFSYITEGCGNVKIFEGNDSPDDSVIRYLPARVHARCVRINPVEWYGHPSLRFDVLGC